MEVMFGLLCVLGLVTAVGHGIWVLVAKLFSRHRRCPGCGRRLGGVPCRRCEGYSLPAGPSPDQLLRQRLHALRMSGRLDEATCLAVIRALAPTTPEDRGPATAAAPDEIPAATAVELPVAEITPRAARQTPPLPAAAPPAEPRPAGLHPWGGGAGRPGFIPPASVPSVAAAPAPVPSPRVPPSPRVAPPPPAVPARQALMAFMEQRNIRWGEIIGGLLIVGCSVALVISVWATIAQHPLLKFGVFTAVLASLFGVGLYAEHRWKLPTTSRGILLIAMLLVPLQFIAVAAMSAGRPPDVATLAGEALSAIVLMAMSMLAARVLLTEAPRLVALGFVLTSATVFLLAHALPQAAGAMPVLLVMTPTIVIYLAGSAAALRSGAKQQQWKSATAQDALSAVGLLAYAALAAGLFLVLSHAGRFPLCAMSPFVLAAGLPPMACGLLVLSRLPRAAANGNWQLAGAVAAVGGLALMSASLLFAWPMPAWLLPMLLVLGAALLLAALFAQAPWAHLPAAALFVAAAMLAVACASGLPWDASADELLAALTHSRSAWVLLACSLAAAGMAGMLRRLGRSHALAWGAVAAACAAASLLWTATYTYAVAVPVTWGWIIFAFYAVLLIAASPRTPLPALAALGWLLLLPVFERLAGGTAHPRLYACYDLSTLALLAAACLPRLGRRPGAAAAAIAWWVSAIAACVALIASPLALARLVGGEATMLSALTAGILLACVLLRPSAGVLAVAQIAAAVAAIIAGLWYGQTHPQAWLSPRWLGLPAADGRQSAELVNALRYGRPMLLALSLLGLAWTLLRHFVARGREVPLLNPAWCADRIITGVSLALLALLLGLPAATAISLELGRPGIATRHALALVGQAAMPATWLLLVALLLNYLLETWQARARGAAWLGGAVVALWLACVVASFEAAPAMASASLLRWLVCVPLLAGIAMLLMRQRLVTLAGSRFATWSPGATAALRAATLLPAAAAIIGLTLCAAALSLAGQKTSGPASGTFFANLGNAFSYLPPLLLLAAVLVVSGLRERSQTLVLCGAGVVHLAVTLAAVLNLPSGVDPIQTLFWLAALNGVCAFLLALGWSGWCLVRDGVASPRPGGIDTLATLGSLLSGVVVIAGALFLLLPLFAAPRLLLPICICLWLAAPAAGILYWLLGDRQLSLRGLWLLALCVCTTLGLSVAAAGEPSWAASLTMLAALLGGGWFVLLAAQPLLAKINQPTARLLEGAATDTVPSGGMLSYERRSPAPAGIPQARPGIHAGVVAFALAAFPFILRALARNPLSPWSAVASLALLALLLGSLGALHRRRSDFYLATAPLLLATSVWWAWFHDQLTGHHWLADLVHLNALCLAGAGAASLLLDRLLFRPQGGSGIPPLDSPAPAEGRGERGDGLPLHRFAGVTLTFLAALSAFSVLLSQGLWNAHETMWLTWGSLAATLGLVAMLLWDRSWALGLWLLYWTQFSMATLLAGNLALPGPQSLYLMLLFWILDGIIWLALCRRLPWLQRWGASPDARTLQRTLLCATSLAGAALLGVPLIEAVEWLAYPGRGDLPIGSFSAAMPLPLVALYGFFSLLSIFVLVRVALNPPAAGLRLSDRLRLACVYAAEVATALLFLHIRLSMPWLFGGIFAQYWPLIVLLLAFAGVGASELLARRGVWVLAQPLGQTGAFLPLLPLLGWSANSRVDLGFILLGAGLLYGALAMRRRHFGFALLAALAMNGGLWRAFYLTPGLALTQHPQLWLIPLALCVLAAAYINRSHLPPAQFAGLRALCLGAIYLSSTADIFISGVAQAPYLPLVLGGLSVAGALAGMWLRVRSMLYLGAGFLLLAIACVIYHASVNLHQTWIIWLAGIACGGGILAVFARFEKKRRQVDELLSQLREWER